MNNSPSNIFSIYLFLERYHQISQEVLAATGMNGLTWHAAMERVDSYIFSWPFVTKSLSKANASYIFTTKP